MAMAHVIYHYDNPGWWAESPDFPEYSAFGDSLDEVRALAREGLRFTADDETLQVLDMLPAMGALTYSPEAVRDLLLSGVARHSRFHPARSETVSRDPALTLQSDLALAG